MATACNSTTVARSSRRLMETLNPPHNISSNSIKAASNFRMSNPFALKVGQVFTGFGIGCGVGIGVGCPVNLGGIPVLQQVTTAVRGRHVNNSLRKMGAKNIEMVGCRVGFGHGFGVGLAIKPGVIHQLQSYLGKINQKNTWELTLVDHLSEIIKVEAEDNDAETNYQKASCTLEAGVKIYASRVDSVHSEAYKVLGGLMRAGRCDEQQEAVLDGDHGREQEEGHSKKEKKMNAPYLCKKDGIVLRCLRVKESPSLWENPYSATTSWKPCAERRENGFSRSCSMTLTKLTLFDMLRALCYSCLPVISKLCFLCCDGFELPRLCRKTFSTLVGSI